MKKSEAYDFIRNYDLNKDNLQCKIPICIPSYKNRKNNVIRNLQIFKDMPIYLFLYEDDYEKSGYDKLGLENMSNVHIIKLKVGDTLDISKNQVPWKSLRCKRAFIQRYMEDKADMYFMSDDDVLNEGKIVNADPEDARTTKSISLYQLLAIWADYHSQHNWSMSTCTSNIAVAHCKENKMWSNNATVIQIFLMNGKLLKENNLYFEATDEWCEDVAFSFRCIWKGLDPKKINWLAYFVGNQDGNNSLVSSLNKHKISTIGTYMYCKGNMRMHYFPDKDLKLTLRRCYPKVDSNYEKLSKIILEAKTNGQDPYDECLNWWKNRNNKDTILSDFFTE